MGLDRVLVYSQALGSNRDDGRVAPDPCVALDCDVGFDGRIAGSHVESSVWDDHGGKSSADLCFDEKISLNTKRKTRADATDEIGEP